MFDRTRSGVADKNRRRRTWSWCFLVEQALREQRNKKAHVEFCFRTEKATFTVCESSAPRSRRGDEESLSLWYEDEGKNLLSKQSPDQSPPLGLDSRKSGARLCVDWL